MKDLDLWRLAKECLEARTPVMLLQVLESWGSSPGRQGFRMVVAADGRMAGSIGGGIMEHKLVEMARHKLEEGDTDPFWKRQIHSKEPAKDQSGMICSGEQTVAFYTFCPADGPSLDQIIQALEDRLDAVLTSTPKDLALETGTKLTGDFHLELQDEGWLYRENLGLKDTLYIIGGGHVGLALSRLMAMLDFNLVLIDDRPGLNTLEQNQYVHRKEVADYATLAERIPAGPHTYIAIMTFGYRPDKVALTALLGREYAYLGLMGSEAKIAQMWKELREEGISEEELARVHSPIGLPIHSRTPEEIAVSIAAQIIQIRNAPHGDAR